MDERSPAPHEESVEGSLQAVDLRHHEETQNNLVEVAIAVRESLQRLERLRDNIAELSDELSSQDSNIPSVGLDLGPSHAAIVLLDAMVDTNADPDTIPEMPRRRSPISTRILERLLEYEASLRPQLIYGMEDYSPSSSSTRVSQQPPTDSISPVAERTRSNILPRPVSTTRPPPYPDLFIPSRRSLLESPSLRRRDIDADDSSTLLGRRVAARAAAGRMNSADHIPQSDRDFLRRSVGIARELQDMTDFLQSRGMRLLERSRARLGVSNTSLSTDSNTSANDVLIDRRVVSLSGRPSRLRRYGAGQTTSETEPQHRTATIAPVRSIVPQIDEQMSRILSSVRADGTDGRNYLVRRRLNADGEEQVHNISLSGWVENALARVPSVSPLDSVTQGQFENRDQAIFSQPPPRPTVTTSASHDRASASSINQSRSPQSTALDSRTRRRNWVRLDAYGNDIPTDEEDELEQRLTLSHIRSLAQIRSSNASAGITPSPDGLGGTTGATLIPMTRASLSHSGDDGGAMARVRLNPPRQVDLPPFAGVLPPPGNPTSRSYRPFEPGPLPMPLVDMMPSPVLHAPRPRIIKVHKYANFAGR